MEERLLKPPARRLQTVVCGRRHLVPPPGSSDRQSHSVCGRLDILMLPDALDRPAGPPKSSLDSPIAVDVGGELRQPVLAIAIGYGAVLGARVPEASVDEHSELQPRERDVGPDPNLTSPDQEVLAEAEPAAVQCGSHADLRLRVRAAVRPSNLRRRIVDRLRVGHSPPATERNGSTRPRCCLGWPGSRRHTPSV